MARADDDAEVDVVEEVDAEGTAGTVGDEDAMMEGESAVGAPGPKASPSSHRNSGGSARRRKRAMASPKRKGR